jgi:aspartate racemase
MIDAAQNIEKGGAEMLTICTNTMHKMYDEVQQNLSIPILHIADATAETIKEQNIETIALLGTKFTMQHDFYKGRLSKNHGINVLTPEGEDLEMVHHIIYDELVLGKIKDESREKYKQIIQQFAKKGAQGVILGCTEIPLLIQQHDVSIPVFDTTTIHAEKTVEFAINS